MRAGGYAGASKWRPFRRLQFVRSGFWVVAVYWWARPHRTVFAGFTAADWRRRPGQAFAPYVLAWVCGPFQVGCCDISRPDWGRR